MYSTVLMILTGPLAVIAQKGGKNGRHMATLAGGRGGRAGGGKALDPSLLDKKTGQLWQIFPCGRHVCPILRRRSASADELLTANAVLATRCRLGVSILVHSIMETGAYIE